MSCSLNNRKKKVIVTSKKWIISKCTVTVSGIRLGQVQKFKYLGTQKTSDRSLCYIESLATCYDTPD